jgi:hypothetical protein
MRSACAGEAFYKAHEGKRYCVLHFPDREKSEDFSRALKRKLENEEFDFRGVSFPEKVSFKGFEFGSDADFGHATFWNGADFSHAHFKEKAYFNAGSFNYLPVDFSFALFDGPAYFGGRQFEVLADFRSATFGAQSFFGGCKFTYGADFRGSSFAAIAYFAGVHFHGYAWFSSVTFGVPGGPANFDAAFRSRPKPKDSKDDSLSEDSLLRMDLRADFSGANFHSQTSFRDATFNLPTDFLRVNKNTENKTEKTEFVSAVFNAEVRFQDAIFPAMADFSYARFNESAADFSSAGFGPSNFSHALFKVSSDFRLASFNEPADFSNTTFAGQTDFRAAQFKSTANLSSVLIESYLRFAGANGKQSFGSESSLDLQFATIEKPECVSFHTLTLRPVWFVNVDARAFSFTNVDWDWRNINDEIEHLRTKAISTPHRLMAIAYRHLAVNAEDNHQYEDASRFRYLAMDARRLDGWRGFTPWRLSWWYWLASGYGERMLRAFLVILAIWLVAGLLYTRVGFARWEPRTATESDVVTATRDNVGAALSFSRALTYSAGVMTLQRPEPRPATTAAQTLVLLETILGPVQAALLALAIRRKFMR